MKKGIKITALALFVMSSSSFATATDMETVKQALLNAHQVYKSGSNDQAITALEQLANLLETNQTAKQGLQLGPNNLSMTYARLGLLHERAADANKAKVYFDKAVEAYKTKTLDVAQIKQLVARLDEQH